MTRVIRYDNHYNTEHWEYWASKMDLFCKPGEIHDGRWLVLSERSGDYGYLLVDLEIVLLYEHDDVIYKVEETKSGKYKVIKVLGEQR
jgi:hypothetical protein